MTTTSSPNGTNVDPDRATTAALENSRVLVTGLYQRSDTWTDPHTSRIYPTVCLAQVEHNGKIIAGHCWVHHAQPIKDVQPQPMEPVQLSAIVRKYKHKEGYWSWHLDCPEDVLVKRPVAVKIPEAKPFSTPPVPAPAEPVAPSRAQDAILIIRQVRQIANLVGGWDQLAELIAELKP